MSGVRGAAQRGGGADMTRGDVFRHIFYFSLPCLAGNGFQQLYNMADTWVVGNYVGDEAFSAVGTVTPVINMLIGTFMGFSSGAGVVISQYYGAGNRQRVHDAVQTAVVMTAVLSVVFTIVGKAMTPLMLRFMRTPEDVLPESMAYLDVYFSYIAGLLFYNMGAGILRAVGDSRRPFYYLVAAAFVNVVLDLVLVIVFGLGVRGVAYATVVSQGISALLAFSLLLRTDMSVKLTLRDLRVDLKLLWKIVRVGVPAAVQIGIVSFSNVFVQSYINQFGKYCMGGWTAYHKIDQLIFLPMQSLGLAATTFVGQNLGRGLADRARRGVRTALLCAVAVTLAASTLVVALAPQLVAVFNPEPRVVEFGAMFLHFLTPFYVLCCVSQVYTGALRGAGNSKVPMVMMIFSFVVFRQCYLFVVSRYVSNTPLSMGMSYPAGWMVSSILAALYYGHARLEATRLVERGEVLSAEEA